MEFIGTPLELCSADFENNERLRKHFKLMLNAALGKFAQKLIKQDVHFVKSSEEINRLARTQKITAVQDLSDSLCQITTEALKESSSPYANSVLYSFITARTRIRLHKNISLLENAGHTMYYCDCDSLIFSSSKPNLPTSLDIGSSFGQFKRELGQNAKITQFVCHGRKNFKISFVKDNCTETLFRVRGISITSVLAKKDLEKKFYSAVEANAPPQKIAQVRHIQKKPSFLSESTRQDITLTQTIECQRYVDFLDKGRKTYPWGFCRS